MSMASVIESAGSTSGGPSASAQRERVAVEQRDQLARHGRQQRGRGVDSLRAEPGGAQLREPRVDAFALHDDDRHAAGFGGALAEREVQILDFVGDALFEREGNDLRELGGALRRRLAVGGERIDGRHDDGDTPSDGERRPPARARPTRR